MHMIIGLKAAPMLNSAERMGCSTKQGNKWLWYKQHYLLTSMEWRSMLGSSSSLMAALYCVNRHKLQLFFTQPPPQLASFYGTSTVVT
jgi:hypothetical protein